MWLKPAPALVSADSGDASARRARVRVELQAGVLAAG